MNKVSHTQRLVKNEVLARQSNKLAGMAIGALDTNIDKVFFNCECSDKTCQQKISLSIVAYRKLHENGNRFVIFPHHQTDAVETVIKRTSIYWVVEKYSLAVG